MTDQTPNTNLDIFHALARTDHRHVKNVSQGGRSFSSIQPAHKHQILTAAFGPCGYGYGWKILDKEFRDTAAGLTLFVAVQPWYRHPQTGEITILPEVMDSQAVTRTTKDATNPDGSILRKGIALLDETFIGIIQAAGLKGFNPLGLCADIPLGGPPPSGNTDQAPSQSAPRSQPEPRTSAPGLLSPKQQNAILKLRAKASDDDFRAALAHHGAKTIEDLTGPQSSQIITWLGSLKG